MLRVLSLVSTLALAPLAQAETYTACLTFHDDRTFFPGDDTRNEAGQGVPGLAVEFLISTAVGTWTVRPTALTGDDGCVSLERDDILFTLLATRFRARFLFDTDMAQIRAHDSREVGALMSPSVSIGEVSHRRIGRVEGPTEGLAPVWRTMIEGLEAHNALVGDPDVESLKLVVKYPRTGNKATVSQASKNGIRLSGRHKTDAYTMLHELTHVTHTQMAGRGIKPNYCYNSTGLAPFDYGHPPYVYEEPPRPFASLCTHEVNGWLYSMERPGRAYAEGYAYFGSLALGAEILGEDIPCSESTALPLNTDGERNEHAVTQALCDLVDGGVETVRYQHVYRSPDTYASEDLDLRTLGGLGSNQTHAYTVSLGRRLYVTQITLGPNPQVTLFERIGRVSRNARADEEQVCVIADEEGIVCVDLQTRDIDSFPMNADDVQDIALAGGDLYYLLFDAFDTTGLWRIRDVAGTPSEPERLAFIPRDNVFLAVREVAGGTPEVYLASEDALRTCEWSGDTCVATAVPYDSEGNAIQGLTVARGGVHVLLDHFVDRIDGGGVTRVMGRDADDHAVFKNNADAMATELEEVTGFATDGTYSLVAARWRFRDAYRRVLPAPRTVMLVDSSLDADVDEYCGTEAVSLPAGTVLAAAADVNRYTSVDVLLEEMVARGALSEDSKQGVLETNTIALRGCAQEESSTNATLGARVTVPEEEESDTETLDEPGDRLARPLLDDVELAALSPLPPSLDRDGDAVDDLDDACPDDAALVRDLDSDGCSDTLLDVSDNLFLKVVLPAEAIAADPTTDPVVAAYLDDALTALLGNGGQDGALAHLERGTLTPASLDLVAANEALVLADAAGQPTNAMRWALAEETRTAVLLVAGTTVESARHRDVATLLQQAEFLFESKLSFSDSVPVYAEVLGDL